MKSEGELIDDVLYTSNYIVTSNCVRGWIDEKNWPSAYWGEPTKNYLKFFATLLDKHEIPYRYTKIESGRYRAIKVPIELKEKVLSIV